MCTSETTTSPTMKIYWLFKNFEVQDQDNSNGKNCNYGATNPLVHAHSFWHVSHNSLALSCVIIHSMQQKYGENHQVNTVAYIFKTTTAVWKSYNFGRQHNSHTYYSLKYEDNIMDKDHNSSILSTNAETENKNKQKGKTHTHTYPPKKKSKWYSRMACKCFKMKNIRAESNYSFKSYSNEK